MIMKNIKQKLHCQKKRAFTLIELVVTLFIASIVIGIFAMLLDFSIKSIDQSQTVNNNLDTAIHISNLVAEEINASKDIYSSKDFKLNPGYNNSLGFVLRLRSKDNYTYIYYAYRDEHVYRLAYNTSIDDISQISFVSLKGKGLNTIVGGVTSIDGTGYDSDTGIVTLNFEITNNNTEVYSTQIFTMGKAK